MVYIRLSSSYVKFYRRGVGLHLVLGCFYTFHGGPGSSVAIATGYGLDGPGIESRWGTRFSAPVRTGPGIHPASCTMGTGSFPGVKSGRGVTLTPHPLLVPWSRKNRATLLLPLWADRSVQSLSVRTRMHFTFNFYLLISWNLKGKSKKKKKQIRLRIALEDLEGN